MPLELIADERAGAKSQAATNRRTGCRVPDRGANETTRRRAAENTNSGRSLSRCERPTGAADNRKRSCQ